MQTYLEVELARSGMTREDFAAKVYKNRNLSKEERSAKQWQLSYPHQPIGWYLRGRGSLWVPHPQEVRPCCQVLSLTSQHKYPWAYQRHCRSIRHIALLLNVDESDIRGRVKEPRKRCSCGKYIKQDDYACGNCRE
jgi:hypothetical protein